MPKRMQTLLTGFGPFGNIVQNPSERLLAVFEMEEVAGQELTVCALPTSYARAPQIMRAALEVGGRGGQPFDTILMLGVAGGSPRWRVEQYGRNTMSAIPDVDGSTPPEGVSLLPDAPEALPVRFPVMECVEALEKAGLPVVASESAGGYLCNALLYTTLHHLDESGHPARAGFLHIPADEQTYAPGLTSAPVFAFDRHLLAVRTVLTVLAETAS